VEENKIKEELIARLFANQLPLLPTSCSKQKLKRLLAMKVWLRFLILAVPLLWVAMVKADAEEGGGDIDETDYEIWDLMDAALQEFGPGLSWYEVFSVDESASSSDIQREYRKLSLQYHPGK
jgi:hypothetical protein